MASINKATPRYINHGVRDESPRQIPYEPFTTPQFLILAPIFTKRGDTVPKLVNSNTFDLIYGKESLDIEGKYFTHQSLLVKEILAIGGQVMVQRITTPESKEASMHLYVEVIPTTKGIKVLWHHVLDVNWIKENSTTPYTEDTFPTLIEQFREHTTTDTSNGTSVQLSDLPEKSLLMHVMSTSILGVGEHGNEYGFRLSTPHGADIRSNPLNILGKRLGLKVYNLEVVKRNLVTGTTTVLVNKYGDPTSEIVLSADVYHPDTNQPLSIDEVLLENWNITDRVREADNLFSDVDVNYNNIAKLQFLLWGISPDATDINATPRPDSYGSSSDNDKKENPYSVDIVTGYDYKGIRRNEFEVVSNRTFNSVHWYYGAAMYHVGGIQTNLEYDKLDTPEKVARWNANVDENMRIRTNLYETLVYSWMSHHLSQETYLRDKARFPFRDLVDSGFSFMVKDLLPLWTTLRKDINVITSTFGLVPTPKLNNTNTNDAGTNSSTNVNTLVNMLLASKSIDDNTAVNSSMLYARVRKDPSIARIEISYPAPVVVGSPVIEMKKAVFMVTNNVLERVGEVLSGSPSVVVPTDTTEALEYIVKGTTETRRFDNDNYHYIRVVSKESILDQTANIKAFDVNDNVLEEDTESMMGNAQVDFDIDNAIFMFKKPWPEISLTEAKTKVSRVMDDIFIGSVNPSIDNTVFASESYSVNDNSYRASIIPITPDKISAGYESIYSVMRLPYSGTMAVLNSYVGNGMLVGLAFQQISENQNNL